MLPHVFFLIYESELFYVIVKQCICLLNWLVVIGVIFLLRSDSDQYNHQWKGRLIASYFKLSNKSQAYGRHWISRSVWLVALTQKNLQKNCIKRREKKNHVSDVTCHVSAATCQVSGVRCQESGVTCPLSCVTCHTTKKTKRANC